MFRSALVIAAKDLHIERRSKVAISQIVPFAITVLLLFGFALDPDTGMLRMASAGLFWVAVLLSTVLVVQRSFAIEARDNALEGLRLTGLGGPAIFLGKALAIATQVFLLQIALAIGAYILFDAPISGIAVLLLTGLLGVIGLASAGAIYGVLVSGTRARESLLPLLFLPVVAPVLLAATRASEAALGDYTYEAWPWLRLLALFAVFYVVIGLLAFSPLLEEGGS